MPALRAMRRTEGRKMATTPVELMTVPIAVTAAIKRTMSRAGHEGFRFFDFTRFGVPVLVAATAYMVAARRWLSPDAAAPEDRHASRPRLSQWIQEYDLAERHFRLRLEAHSP